MKNPRSTSAMLTPEELAHLRKQYLATLPVVAAILAAGRMAGGGSHIIDGAELADDALDILDGCLSTAANLRGPS